MANKFRLPEVTFIGENALAAAEEEIAKLGKKALIVAGRSMIRQGHVSAIQEMLERHSVGSAVFSDIPGEPTDRMIEEGHKVYQKEGCDFIIGIGGGSPLDSAKAVGILATSGGRTDHPVANRAGSSSASSPSANARTGRARIISSARPAMKTGRFFEDLMDTSCNKNAMQSWKMHGNRIRFL